MRENLTGLVKIVGISALLFILCAFLSWMVPDKFLQTGNIENLLRRTALFGILGIGVAFVIITGGIDLSIGSLVCLCGCCLSLLLTVTYHPDETSGVYELNAEEMYVIVTGAEGEYEAGDKIWFYEDRRNNALVSIKQVAANANGTLLYVEGTTAVEDAGEATNNKGIFRRSIEPGAETEAYVARAYNVASIEKRKIGIDPARPPPLIRNDQVRLVHPTAPMREVLVESTAAGSIDLKTDLDLSEEHKPGYWLVPYQRRQPLPIPVAILAVLAIATLLGLVHGLLITKLKLQPFIVTLCGLLIYRGLARWIQNDQSAGFEGHEETLLQFGQGKFVLWQAADGAFGIPYAFFFLVAIAIVAMIFLNWTIWGRYIMALGRNEEAARYSGVNTSRMTILAYVICGLLTGIGGVMWAIDSRSIAPSAFGNLYELYAIAAAVLGGCSLRGGEGSITGAVIGTAVMQTLKNSIVLLAIPNTLEFTMIGTVILLGVIADEMIRRFASSWGSTRRE